jgi:hypothetical protein
MKREPAARVIAVASALLCCVGLAFAGILAGSPADNAKIEGFVQDPAGTAIAKVAITLQPASGAEKKAWTDEKGNFSFGSLAAGAYVLTMEAPGFQKARYTNIKLTDAQSRQFDFMLRPGAISEALEIDITRPYVPPPSSSTDSSVLALNRSGSSSAFTGTISGRIRNADGSSASGVTVGAVSADSGLPGGFGLSQVLSLNTRADSLGFYRLENLPSGRYFIVAGTENFLREGAVIDRPVFFPGTDSSRAVAISVGPGREEIADFRLDSPLIFQPGLGVPRLSSAFQVRGQLLNDAVAVPLLGRSEWVERRPLAWGRIRVTMEPAVIALIDGGFDGLRRAPGGACRPPAQASFTSAVSNEGQFTFALPSGVYDLCVFQQGGGVGAGGRGGGAAWGVFAGPFSVVVDRDIETLIVDLGRR